MKFFLLLILFLNGSEKKRAKEPEGLDTRFRPGLSTLILIQLNPTGTETQPGGTSCPRVELFALKQHNFSVAATRRLKALLTGTSADQPLTLLSTMSGNTNSRSGSGCRKNVIRFTQHKHGVMFRETSRFGSDNKTFHNV